MQALQILLAQANPDTAQKINNVCEVTCKMPESFRYLMPLMIITAVLVITIFWRQKKIAQNQVDLANILSQLIEKKK